MFDWLKRTKQPRIFLGTLAVAPRSGFKSRIEQWALFSANTEDLDEGVRNSLESIFTFPTVDSVSDPKASDLVIDVVVPDFQGGQFVGEDFVALPLLTMWRPKVKVASRLYYLKSKKTKKKFLVTKSMPVTEYLGRAFSWRGFVRLKPLFDSNDLDHLINQACLELLDKIKKTI